MELIAKALQLAQQGLGFCAPNPAVGAVAVCGGIIIGEGFHHGPGRPHAEVEALRDIDGADKAIDLYVTLEPCCHHGRTPPCTDLIISKNIKRVFFAYFDPNPQVAGNGQRILQEAGIECYYLQSDDVDHFYQAYQYWWQYKRPFVTTKLALTADRKTRGRYITGAECQLFTQQQRLYHDALLTTAATIIADSPRYNVRLIDAKLKKPIYILDSQARLPRDATIFETCESVTVFYKQSAPKERVKKLEDAGARCIVINSNDQKLSLQKCLEIIGQDGKHSLWVEAGWICIRSFIQQRLARRIIFYFSADKAMTQELLEQISFVFENGIKRDIKWQSMGKDMALLLA